MIGLPNPWVLLAVVLGGAFAITGSYMKGHSDGHHEGTTEIQSKWNKQQAADRQERDANAHAAQETTRLLQASSDQRKQEDAKKLEDLAARNAALLSELSERPARPTTAATPAPAAGAGTNGRCTGTGLYRDDAVFLAGKAELWQRIRLQRDACYASYAEAHQRIEDLEARQREVVSEPRN